MTDRSDLTRHMGRGFSLLHSVLIGPGARTASYPVGSGRSFPGGKAVGASSSRGA
jgi:hypothetical protein